MAIKNLLFFKSSLFCLIILLCLNNSIIADEPAVIINRSNKVHVVDGEKFYFHAVLQGQTLFSIARAYGVSVEDIKKVNPELRYGLMFDQLIKIPYVEQTKEIDEKEFVEHKVIRSETLFSISRKYGITIDDIFEANPGAREKELKENQVLLIPQFKETGKEVFTYKVKPKDTFYSLSRKFGVSVDEILEWNPEIGKTLQEGQKIKLPSHIITQDVVAEKEDTQEYLRRELIYTRSIKTRYEKELYDKEYCQDPVYKEVYSIALFLPLFTEEIKEQFETGEKLTEENRAFSFIEFYYGFKVALDSLKNMGVNLNVYLMDVCQDVSKAKKAVDELDFHKLDLIIGPFFPSTIEYIADYANKYEIPMVSPFLQDRSQLKYYSNLFQVTPSLSTKLNNLADYISYKYPNDNIIVVHTDQPHVAGLVNTFYNDLNSLIGERRFFIDSVQLAKINGYYYDDVLVGERVTDVPVFDRTLLNNFNPPDSQQTQYQREKIISQYREKENIKKVAVRRDTLSVLFDKLDSDKNNILVSLFGGEPIVSNYIRQLSLISDTENIITFGVPQWKNYRSIEIDNLQNAKVHIITSDFIDYSEANNQAFVYKYREMFNDEPGLRAFKGGDIGFYFLSAMLSYGKEFHKCIYEINQKKGYSSPVYIKSEGIDNGWENQNATIFKYQDYRMIDARKPGKIIYD